jgi:nucleoid DNA-binding protein
MSEKITFSELIDEIAASTDQSVAFSTEFIHELVKVIEAGLRENGSVIISGFGKFELRWIDQRKGRNPQTGEELTIPAQNKIAFTPYKKLREHVNFLYKNVEPKILDESGDLAEAESPIEKPTLKESEKSGSLIETIEVPDTDEGDNDNDLLIERPHPGFKSKKPRLEDLVVPEAESAPRPQVSVSPVRKRFYTNKYTYLYLILLLLLIIVAIYYFASRSAREEVSVIEPETEPSPVEKVEPSRETEEEAGIEEAGPDTEPEGPESITVEDGENLWSIAQSELGNPYLWPLIYELNKDKMENPNRVISGTSLTLPQIDDPENLTDQQLKDVAESYLSVYQWVRSEKPEEAKFFLWGAGAFSLEVVLGSADEVDPADLEFARRR